MFIRKWKFTKEIHKAYRDGFSDGEANMAAYMNRDNCTETHPKSFELLLEPYCDGCMEFDPAVERPEISTLYGNGIPAAEIRSGPTVIRCQYRKQCASMCEHVRRSVENGN